jgi:transcriptional regulator with XRE-family HTH domain
MSLPQTPEAWKRLGDRIRADRERQGLSRKKLANLANVSPGSVQSAEGGTVRARWPQTLSAIERALGWAPGSMRSVLEGGDVEYQADLFDNSTPAAAGAPPEGAPPAKWFNMERHGQPRDEGGEEEGLINESPAAGGAPPTVHEATPGKAYPTADYRAWMIASLPGPIRERLRDVLSFGRACVEYGAPPWVASAYDNAVNGLLLAVLNGPGEQSEAVLVSYLEDSTLRPWSNAMQAHHLAPAMTRRYKMLTSQNDAEGGDPDVNAELLTLRAGMQPHGSFDASLESFGKPVKEQLKKDRLRNRIQAVEMQLLSKALWTKSEILENLEGELKALKQELATLESGEDDAN